MLYLVLEFLFATVVPLKYEYIRLLPLFKSPVAAHKASPLGSEIFPVIDSPQCDHPSPVKPWPLGMTLGDVLPSSHWNAEALLQQPVTWRALGNE